jgi:hypothetical protein
LQGTSGTQLGHPVIAENDVGLEQLQSAHESLSGLDLDYGIAAIGALDGARDQVRITCIRCE